MKAARPVRRAGRGNGPRAISAPRPGPTPHHRAAQRSAIGTLVERQTRMVWLLHLPAPGQRHSACRAGNPAGRFATRSVLTSSMRVPRHAQCGAPARGGGAVPSTCGPRGTRSAVQPGTVAALLTRRSDSCLASLRDFSSAHPPSALVASAADRRRAVSGRRRPLSRVGPAATCVAVCSTGARRRGALGRAGRILRRLVDGRPRRDRYRFLLDEDHGAAPTRPRGIQPEGPHGPSEVVDPDLPLDDDDVARRWRPSGGCSTRCTSAPSRRRGPGQRRPASCRSSPSSASRSLELMPVAEFAGRFGWGYDGVDLFAPTAALRHARRLPPLRGPRPRARARRDPRRRLQPLRPGRQLPRASSPTTTSATRYADRVGRGDQLRRRRLRPGPRVLRRERRATGSTEFHLDGLRLDAAQNIFDDSPVHILREIADGGARRRAGAHRPTWSPRTSRRTPGSCGPPRQGGFGLDALWNDDFHHSAMVAATGRDEAYYADYRGIGRRSSSRPRSTASSTRASGTSGRSSAAARRRSTCPPSRFVTLPAEPRPGRELLPRAAAARADQPARAARADRAAAARSADADALPGAGVRGLEPVPLLRRPQARARRAGARGPQRSSSASSRASAPPGMQRRCSPTRATAATFVRSQARPARTRDSTPRPSRCTATCWRCAARTRSSRARTTRGVDGAVLGPERLRAALRRGAERAAAGREPRRPLHLDPVPGAAARAAGGHASGDVRWSSAKIPRYGGCGHAAARRPTMDGWCIPGRLRRVFGPRPPVPPTTLERSTNERRRIRSASRGSADRQRPPAPLADGQRVAGDQRPGRLRLGDGRRRDDAQAITAMLVAALPAPLGRMMMLQNLLASIRVRATDAT